MNAERVKNLADKEALCAKIEELVQNAEMFWKDKYKAMQEIQENWKNIGMVPKENVAALTERFKATESKFAPFLLEFANGVGQLVAASGMRLRTS